MSNELPDEILALAEIGINNSVPKKSSGTYNKTYQNFIEWKEAKKVPIVNETVVLAYFVQLSKTKSPTTLYGIFSMLKSIFNQRHNVNLGKLNNQLKIKKYTSVLIFFRSFYFKFLILNIFI